MISTFCERNHERCFGERVYRETAILTDIIKTKKKFMDFLPVYQKMAQKVTRNVNKTETTFKLWY